MGHILFNTPGVTPPGGGGDNYFDDTYWTPAFFGGGASWSTDRWVGAVSPTRIAIDPIGGWAAGYNPQTMDITIDDITGGSSTFSFDLTMTNGPNVFITAIPLSDGQTYNFDVSSGGDTPSRLDIFNLAGGTDGMSITNIVFHI